MRVKFPKWVPSYMTGGITEINMKYITAGWLPNFGENGEIGVIKVRRARPLKFRMFTQLRVDCQTNPLLWP